MTSPSEEDFNKKDMEKVDELPAINENDEDVESHIYNIDYEDVDSHTYNYIDHDEVHKEPQAREHHISAGTPHVAADNKVTNPLTNAMNKPGGLQQTKHGAPRCKNGSSLLAGTCLRLSVTKLSYDDAKAACKKEEATLAVPKTKELDVALRDLVTGKGDNCQYWIGMRDKAKFVPWPLGSYWIWTWEDGSLVEGYKAWNPGQPSNPRFPRLCGQYWSRPTGSPMWDDDACYKPKRFICQHSPA
ncbi:PREDICTED: CD209 antigen-like protein A [Branchiostoma belcheri]|uniref:CD209 antigen-like protein A n=1 Tax=Branchiostoma belcheri TaxID=7741 RepID=A0A6P4YU99_BRABE|nr:PREDICTED: CD209 antigen-like protein A [Branchiostoma belcheri]